MNKEYQLKQLGRMLQSPQLQSGLYLLDTDLSDDELENFLKSINDCHYIKEVLVPTTKGNALELFLVGLSHSCDRNLDVSQLSIAEDRGKDTLLYKLLIDVLKGICRKRINVIHICGEVDLSSICSEDLHKLHGALLHNIETILVIGRQKSEIFWEHPIIKTILMKEKTRASMGLSKVYISYKHDSKYDDVIDSIKNGLRKNGINYSIDQESLQYRDNIEAYEKEIGQADKVIMLIISGYFHSLACMFEMTQIFRHGRVEERVFPIVDMGDIPRNGDGLSQIKEYWQQEKEKKALQITKEPGHSEFRITEITKIDDIIRRLDDFWKFIVHVNTASIDELTKDDAAMLIVALKKSLCTSPVDTDMCRLSLLSTDTKPTTSRAVVQHGDKSIYIENNSGDIIIN
ncbi:hypothetical protein HMPREF1989_00095 [Porphyromonas gingivalis F0566]|uniref:toll/interleukin-1 receptor domain-containing protein n=1 Tax=Porphyromonas gingivalis TaxID=837 RepID=UPI0003AD3A65|nr:toll/interleukin-1 receptor domain-containing protein [Porphyromonas gingivalis]ERJ88996.1 hypothetical protein HMPREF1989_00095 [Porphyromonas gingivalis F0566]